MEQEAKIENSHEVIITIGEKLTSKSTQLAIEYAKKKFGDQFDLENKEVNEVIKAFINGFNMARDNVFNNLTHGILNSLYTYSSK